jgi:hypothetical protein
VETVVNPIGAGVQSMPRSVAKGMAGAARVPQAKAMGPEAGRLPVLRRVDFTTPKRRPTGERLVVDRPMYQPAPGVL